MSRFKQLYEPDSGLALRKPGQSKANHSADLLLIRVGGVRQMAVARAVGVASVGLFQAQRQAFGLLPPGSKP
jgi:hypothetical protein